MQLLNGERIIAPATGGFPALTTHRLWHESKDASVHQIRTIFLEDLCYSSVTHQEQPLWMVLAVIGALGGMLLGLANSSHLAGYIVLGGIVCALCWKRYNASKKQLLTLAAASGEISVELHSSDLTRGAAFVETVVGAKNERVFAIRPSDLKAHAAGL
jgi:hypothetical protein